MGVRIHYIESHAAAAAAALTLYNSVGTCTRGPNWNLKHNLPAHGPGIPRCNSPLVLLAFGFFPVRCRLCLGVLDCLSV
jgi:hypothetical protein